MFTSVYKASAKFFPMLFAFASIIWFAHGALAAAANESVPEYFHQAPAGATELSIHAGYRTFTARAVGGTDSTLSGLDRLGVEFDHGINEMFAIMADLSYSTYSVTPGSSKNSGIEPLIVKLQGLYPLSGGAFVYGLAASVGLEKASINAGGDVNRSYGDIATGIGRSGLELAPYVGYAMGIGDSVIGGRVRYTVLDMDSTVTTPFGDVTVGAENAGRASLFYEYRLTDMPLGAALLYDWFSKPSISTANGLSIGGIGARSLIGLQLYTAMNYGGFVFKPVLEWREKAGGDYDKTSDLKLTLVARMGF